MLLTGILFTIPWFFICLLLYLYLSRRLGINRWLLVALFQIKVIATFCVQAIYTYYYTDRSLNDVFRYFDDGIILSDVFSKAPMDYIKIILGIYDEVAFRGYYFDKMNAWIKPYDSGLYNDNILMIKVNSLLNFFSLGHYEVNALFFSTIGLIGLSYLCRAILENKVQRQWALLIICLFPSFQLLMSGGLKETLLIYGIGITLMAATGDFTVQTRLFYGLVGLIISGLIKPYFIACMLPGLIAISLFPDRAARSWVAWILIVALGYASAHLMGIDLVNYIVQKQHDFINHSLEIEPGSYRPMARLDYSLISIIVAAPLALIKTLIQPMPWEIRNVGEVIMLIENLYLLVLLVFAGRNLAIGTRNIKAHSKIRMALLTIILGLILIGLICPVLGATMRYRAPFIILLLVSLTPYLINFRTR